MCYFIASLSNYILIAYGEQKKILIINAIIAVINIIGNIIFIPHFSFMGAAWVTLITQILLVIISWWIVRASYDNRENIRRGIWIIVSAGIAGYISITFVNGFIPLHSVHLSEVLLRGGLGGIMYACIFFSLWWLGRRYYFQLKN